MPQTPNPSAAETAPIPMPPAPYPATPASHGIAPPTETPAVSAPSAAHATDYRYNKHPAAAITETMPIFDRQSRARRRSLKLTLLFAAATAATVAAVSLVGGGLLRLISPQADPFWCHFLPAVMTAASTAALSFVRLHQLDADGAAVAEALGGELLVLENATAAERRLLNIVTETAIAAALPPPRVYLLRRDGSINAFAAGSSPRHAAVGFTAGALAALDRDELQALAAHETAHIKNGDNRLNQRLSGWLYGLHGIGSSGRYLLWGKDETALEYRRRKNVDNHPFDNGLEILLNSLPLLQLAGALLLVLGAAGSIAAACVQAAVCRQREFLADAAAVQYTRQHEPLIRALIKTAARPHRLVSAHAPEYAHMMFYGIGGGNLLATHPSTAERIRRLDPDRAAYWLGQLHEQEHTGLRLHTGTAFFHRPAPAEAVCNPEQEYRESEYRRQADNMAQRIRRFSPQTPPPLPAAWRAAACDGEYAAAALIAVLTAARPASKLPPPLDATFIPVQIRRFAAQTPPDGLRLIESVLPAFLMQEADIRHAVIAALAADPAVHSGLLSVLKAYLAPPPDHGRETDETAALTLWRQADAGQAACWPQMAEAALPLDEAAKRRLLNTILPTAAAQPLRWRYLCVRLNMPAWHFPTV